MKAIQSCYQVQVAFTHLYRLVSEQRSCESSFLLTTDSKITLPSLISYNISLHSCPICLSVVIITFLPQLEKPQARTAVFVSYLDSVVAVSQSQNLKLLSADPEIK